MLTSFRETANRWSETKSNRFILIKSLIYTDWDNSCTKPVLWWHLYNQRMWWRPVHIPAGTHLPSSPQRGSPVGCHITLCPQLVGLGREGEMLYFHVSLKRGRKKHRAAVCVNPAMPSAWPAGPIPLPLPGESATSLLATNKQTPNQLFKCIDGIKGTQNLVIKWRIRSRITSLLTTKACQIDQPTSRTNCNPLVQNEQKDIEKIIQEIKEQHKSEFEKSSDEVTKLRNELEIEEKKYFKKWRLS